MTHDLKDFYQFIRTHRDDLLEEQRKRLHCDVFSPLAGTIEDAFNLIVSADVFDWSVLSRDVKRFYYDRTHAALINFVQSFGGYIPLIDK